MTGSDYSTWKAEQLVARVQALEKDLKEANKRYHAVVNSQSKIPAESSFRAQSNGVKAFDPSKYSTRLIALKFAYLGQNYNGLEYTAGTVTALPTVEEALWTALMKGKLIMPTDREAVDAGQITWEGCDYTKCGRTDKGVSAFGQVISIRVRSNRPLPGQSKKMVAKAEHNDQDGGEDMEVSDSEPPFDPVRDEIPYVHALNRLLPPDIRALAWCSDIPEDFSARFSCRERRYRYFFTNPAFSPNPGPLSISSSRKSVAGADATRRDGWLDIEAMRDAAKRYEGLHDFRNLCKIDPSKQLTDFRRRIFVSEIREIDRSSESAAFISGKAFAELDDHLQQTTHANHFPTGPKIYQFVLHGSAFLWHQVRHMVAVLFLVGQGLEKPDIVDKLFDTAQCPRKPHYEMATDAPLVLWDCIFPDLDGNSREDALDWIYAGDDSGAERRRGEPEKGKFGAAGLVDGLWEVWRRHRMDEILAGSLLNLVVSQGRQEFGSVSPALEKKTKLFLGGDTAASKGPYVPLMKRPCGMHFDVVNARYAAKKGLMPRSEAEIEESRERRKDRRHDHLEEDME